MDKLEPIGWFNYIGMKPEANAPGVHNPKGNTSALFRAAESVNRDKLGIVIEMTKAMFYMTDYALAKEIGVGLGTLIEAANPGGRLTNKTAAKFVKYFGEQINKGV